MKKTIWLIFAFIFTLNVNAQNYNLLVSTQIYQDLEGSISMNNGQIWDDPEYNIPIGFPFEINNTPFDSLFYDGFGVLICHNQFYEQDTLLSYLIPINADLIDRGYSNYISESDISYLIEGNPGNRIFKLEFKNVGFYEDLYSYYPNNDFINYQVWLYESGNIIEYHFGPSSITQASLIFDDNPGPTIGFIANFNVNFYTIEYAMLLSGDPTMPVDSHFYDLNTYNYYGLIELFLDEVPTANTVYNFSQQLVDIENSNSLTEQITLSYISGADQIIINKSDEIEVLGISIINNYGQIIKVNNQPYSNNVIEINDLLTGNYIILIKTNKGALSKKITVKH